MQPNGLPESATAGPASPEGAPAAPDSRRTLSVLWPPFPAVLVLFLTVSYLHLWLRVNTCLAYFWLTPVFPAFAPGWAAFRRFAAYPGGPVEYASAFLSQWFFYPWLGALIVTAVAASQCLALWCLIRRAGGGRPRVLHLVPAALLVVLYDRYASPLPAALALAAALACACLYCAAALGKSARRFVLFAALGAALYYLAGGALLVYGALCGIYELLAGGRRALGVLCLLAVAAAPYAVGVLALGLRITDAYLRLMPYHQDVDERAALVLLVLCAYAVLAVLFAGLWRVLRLRDRAARGGALGLLFGGMFGLGAAAAGVLALGAFAFWWRYDRALTACFEVDYLSRYRAWTALPQFAGQSRPRYDYCVNWDINRALYHNGDLLDEMFGYPQQPSGLLPSSEAMEGVFREARALMKLSDVLWELGAVNGSEHMAQEALESAGPRPWVLYRIAMARIVKGEPEAARVFLRAMSKDVVFGEEARRCLRRLEDEPGLSGDEGVQLARQHMPVKDYAGGLDAESLLLQLLQRDGRNRMAFEYLMAHYLLTGDLEKFVASLGMFGRLGYPRLPRHCQEAVIVYMTTTGRAVDLPAQAIDKQTVERWRGFSDLLKRHGGDRRAAQDEAARVYHNTYFYYWNYYPYGQEAAAP